MEAHEHNLGGSENSVDNYYYCYYHYYYYCYFYYFYFSPKNLPQAAVIRQTNLEEYLAWSIVNAHCNKNALHLLYQPPTRGVKIQAHINSVSKNHYYIWLFCREKLKPGKVLAKIVQETLYRKGDRIRHNIPIKCIPISYIKTFT